ncbi:MAG: DUF4124 domain-containing protein [Nitrospirota bacterium]
MMSRIFVRTALLFALAGGLAGSDVLAAEDDRRFIYQWVDEQGGVHVTDSLQSVPAKQRSRATRIDQGSPGEKDEGQAQAPGQPMQEQAPDAGAALDEDKYRKAVWQQRMTDAKSRMAEAESRYRTLEQEKDALTKSYGGGVSIVMTPTGPVATGAPAMPQEALDRVKKIEQDMVQAKQEADTARNEVENVIPDEARRAGIPPGWLREVE